MKDITENLDDIENIPTIITNIHNRIKKEDNKNNYYSELKLDKDIYNMTTANNYNKNYIYNLINTGLSSYECVCGPRKIRDESKINFSENQINHIIKEIFHFFNQHSYISYMSLIISIIHNFFSEMRTSCYSSR